MRTGRAASHHTPDHPRGHKRPPVLVGDPVLRHYRTARRFRAEHQFPQPGLLGRDGPRPMFSFTSPKLTLTPLATETSPKGTVSDRHPSPGDTSSDTRPFDSTWAGVSWVYPVRRWVSTR
jgi:hypothetical protein